MSILIVSERLIKDKRYLKAMAGKQLQIYPYDDPVGLLEHCTTCAKIFIASWNEDNKVKLALGEAHGLPESSGLIGYVFIVNKAK